MKINNAVKGIIIGFFSFALLEFGTIVVFAGFSNDNMIDFGGIEGMIRFFIPLIIILIICILLGYAIARRNRILKKITVFTTITVAVLIICAYGYFIWNRFNMYVPPIFHAYD